MTPLRKLPPLQTLTAFEAASRLGSFAHAAEELCLTHSAVSHRIRLLEEHLGVRLFLRMAKQIVLTPQGTQFLTTVAQVLELLQAGATEASRAGAGRLKISTLPAFAHSWLVHRIGGFFEQHPDVDVEINTTARVVNLKSGEADVAIRYGLGEWSGLEAVRLMHDNLHVVCSPEFKKKHKSLRAPQDLRSVVLLRHTMPEWERWFRAAGLDWPEPDRGPVFSDSAVMLEAAARGQGVALARSVLAAPLFLSGRIVPLFSISVASKHAYYLVYQRSALSRPEVSAFSTWLLSEVGLKEGAQGG